MKFHFLVNNFFMIIYIYIYDNDEFEFNFDLLKR